MSPIDSQPGSDRGPWTSRREPLIARAGSVVSRFRSGPDGGFGAETEASYRAMVEQVPAVAYAWDPAHEPGSVPAAYISPQIERLLGFTAEQWLDDPDLWSRQVDPRDLEELLTAWAVAVAASDRFVAEYRIRRADGVVVWVRDEAVPVIHDGSIRYRGVIYDVTAERGTAEALREAEERYRSLVEQLPVVTYRSDVHDHLEGDRVDYVSPKVLELAGFTQEEWASPGMWESRIHPDDRTEVVAEARRTDRTGEPFDVEYRLVRKDDTAIWVHDTARVVHRGDGATVWQGVIQDVTDRKGTETRLREAEERYRSLVEQLPAVIYVDALDEQVTARYVSPQYERLTGFTPEERLADPGLWMRILHPDDRDRVVAESNRTNETGEAYDVEHRIVRKDGRIVWVQDHAFLVETPGGERVWQGVLTDITDRKVIEEALASRDRILEAAGYAAERFLRAPGWRDCIDDVLCRLGQAGSVTRAAVFENVEHPDGSQVVLRHAWLADGAPDRLERPPSAPSPYGQEFERWVEVLSGGGVIRGPVAELPDVERATIEAAGIRSVIIVPVHVGGEWWGYIGLDDCVTARGWQHAEVDSIRVVANTLGAAIGREQSAWRLTDAEQRYRAIVEHVPAAIYLDLADRSMRSVYVSPQIEEITGISAQEWLDDPEAWLKATLPEDRDEVGRSYLEAVAGLQPWKAEYRIATRDGRTIWVHDETTFITGDDGRPAFLQGVLMDITERKLAEQALRESERRERDAAERLRTLDEMKNTFLAAVSHELRSPLTSILGLSLTLERAPDMGEEDRGDLLERLAVNARKLDRLLKDLLDLDRLNRGIVEPQYRTVDLAALIRTTVDALDALSDRSVELDLEPSVITADAPKLERIVENLVMNTVRHTPPGCQVWVRVSPTEGGATVTVEDDGPGVPPDLREAIFEPFRQGPTASPHSPGTGVGLSLVARFAELHGGRAWVENRPDGGASFRVFLPKGPERRGPEPEPEHRVEGSGQAPSHVPAEA
ncbi:MAG: PAS domain-containing protein [Actinomycetota bacterium]